MNSNKYPNYPTDQSARLDKWLWCARFYKTRSLANKAIQQGKVKYDHQKPSPSRLVQVGAMLSIETPLYEKTVMVKGITLQRQSAAIAQTLYEETTESLAQRETALNRQKAQRWMDMSAPHPDAKPDKHSRKAMRGLKRKYED